MRSCAARTSGSERDGAVGRDEALALQQLAGGDELGIDPGGVVVHGNPPSCAG